MKLVVSGYAARLFVDGAANPQLTVTSLRRPWTRGMIGLWGFLGGANFSNVIVSPADTTAPAARPAEPPPGASHADDVGAESRVRDDPGEG